jgi:1,4-dihydroxy-2-naphthoate polyprenyltransferase
MNNWIEAARPRTLPLALASILMGSFLAASKSTFNWPIFWLTIATTICLQVLSNFANDYGDTQNGADSAERQGPMRAVQSGEISAKTMFGAIIVMSLLSLCCGIFLLYEAFEGFNSTAFFGFLGIGFMAIIAAITYTAGKKPYGYAGFGDVSVFIFFGLVGVMGTYYLQTKQLNYAIILPAFTSGFFATAVLNINNLRDIDSDNNAGKKTIPVRYGKVFGINYHKILIFLGIIFSIIYALNEHISIFKLLPMLSIPFLYKIFSGIKETDSPQKIDSFLKKMALSSLLFTILFGLGEILTK